MTFSPRRGSMGFARSTTLACVVNVVVRSLGPCSSSPLSPTLCALSLPLYTHTHTQREKSLTETEAYRGVKGVLGFGLFICFWVKSILGFDSFQGGDGNGGI